MKKNIDNSDKAGMEFWDSKWGQMSSIYYSKLEKYLAVNRKFNSLFKKFLPKGNKDILEIGCAKGKMLIYFAKNFNYNIFGIDYSENGVKIAKRNIKNDNLEAEIHCEDLFKNSFKEDSFDIVYSLGLIEHFENPSAVFDEHLKLAKERGLLVLSVPNFNNSIYFKLIKMLKKEKDVVDTHNFDLMNKEFLFELFKQHQTEIIYLDYFGPVDISLVMGYIENKYALIFLHIFNQFLGYITYFMPPSQYLSPYIFFIGKKNTSEKK